MSMVRSRRGVLTDVSTVGAGVLGVSLLSRSVEASGHVLYFGSDNFSSVDGETYIPEIAQLDPSDGSANWSVDAIGSVQDISVRGDGGRVAYAAQYEDFPTVVPGGIEILYAGDGSSEKSLTGENYRSVEYGPNGEYLYAGRGDGQIQKIRVSDLSIVATKNTTTYTGPDEHPADSMALSSGSLFVDAGDLLSLSLSDLSEEWRNTNSRRVTGIASDGDAVFAIQERVESFRGGTHPYSYAVNVDADTGSARWESSSFFNGQEYIGVAPGDGIVYMSEGSGSTITTFDSATGTQLKSASPTGAGGGKLAISNAVNGNFMTGGGSQDTAQYYNVNDYDTTQIWGSRPTPANGIHAEKGTAPGSGSTPTEQPTTQPPTTQPGTPREPTGLLSAGPVTIFGGLFALLLGVAVRYKNPLAVVVWGLSVMALVVRLLFEVGGNLFIIGISLTTIITVVGLVVRINYD